MARAVGVVACEEFWRNLCLLGFKRSKEAKWAQEESKHSE